MAASRAPLLRDQGSSAGQSKVAEAGSLEQERAVYGSRAEWREADDLCSRAALLDSLNVAPTPSPVACCLNITCTKDDAKTCQDEFMEGFWTRKSLMLGFALDLYGIP